MEHGQIDGNAPRDHDDRAALDDDHQKCTKVALQDETFFDFDYLNVFSNNFKLLEK